MPTTTPAADAQYCERVTRQHARTFSFASRFLPAEKRRAAYAVYAFCRTADDIVDNPPDAGDFPARALGAYRERLDRAIAGAPDDPVFRELGRAVELFSIPPRVLHELIAGVARDLDGAPTPRDWQDLATYCEGVTSTVGEMCAYVFGFVGGDAARSRAVRYARTLGIAMQVTNILRDVSEDAASGRCYLPAEDLAAFGLTRDDVLHGAGSLARDERWRPLMAFQVGRARALYEAATPGLSMISTDARRCAVACARGYAAILEAIERQGYDTRYSMSLFVLYFGTRRRYDDIAHHEILMGPRYEALLDDIFRGRALPKDFSLYLHRPTATDPSLAPAGCDSFYALSPVPNLRSPTDWAVAARPYRDAIVQYLEDRCLPGLSSEIVTERSIDPRYFRDTLGAHMGSAFSVEPVLTQSAWFRPHNVSEDVANLYFAGAGTHPGAGLPGVISSGKIVADLIAASEQSPRMRRSERHADGDTSRGIAELRVPVVR